MRSKQMWGIFINGKHAKHLGLHVDYRSFSEAIKAASAARKISPEAQVSVRKVDATWLDYFFDTLYSLFQGSQDAPPAPRNRKRRGKRNKAPLGSFLKGYRRR